MNEHIIEDREIDMKDLFRFIFSKWKLMINWAFLFALLFCGYKEFTYISSRYGNPSPYEQAQEMYDQAQEDYEDQIKAYDEIIDSYNEQIRTATDPGTLSGFLTAINSAEQDRKNLAQPEKPELLNNNNSLKSFLKIIFTGIIFGLIVGAFYYAIKYMFDGVIHNKMELKITYNIRNLGLINSGKRSKKNHEKESVIQSNEDIYGLVSAKLNILNRDKEDIAVIGPVSDKTLESQASELGIKQAGFAYIPLGKITIKPERLAKLSEYKCAVLVIRIDHSKVKDISEMMDCLNAAKITVLGYLVLQ